MSYTKNILLIIFLAFVLSGCTGSYDSYDQNEYLEEEISDLEYELNELETCQEELQYAIEEAKYNLENGYYQDAYYDLDGVSRSCL